MSIESTNISDINNSDKCENLEIDNTNEMVKDGVETLTEIKERIYNELNKKGFPNMDFIFSKEALKHSKEVLDELLEKDKKDFKLLLEIPNESLKFSDFMDDDILDYYWGLLNHLDSVEQGDEIKEIIEYFEPRYDDFYNQVIFSKELYEKYVYALENLENLNNDEVRFLEKNIKSFKLSGIDLPKEKQDKIKEINIEASKLSTKFVNNIVDDKKDYKFVVKDFEVIKDLPKDILDQAKKAGEETGDYIFDADPTSYGKLMEYCTDSRLRKKLSEERNMFASYGKYDNRETILNILKLKEEKSKLLGYNTYADFSLAKKMADSPKQIFDLIGGISEKAKEKGYKELEEIREYYNLEKLESHDVAFYSRKLKEDKYGIDQEEVKKYFNYENVLKYLFDFVQDFYSIEIKKSDVKPYHNDVSVYEIYKEGKLISYYFIDPFYRKTKRGGAWANNLRNKFTYGEEKVPVVLNVCNFNKASNGKTNIYMDDAITIFHEFGHALHLILSESNISSLSGFSVEWDFVELPSQLLENWVHTKESLEKLAINSETGEKIPSELVEKLEKNKTFLSGLFVARQNEFALMDMALHDMKAPESIEELDKVVLDLVNDNSIYTRDEKYKMYCSFGHIFGGGYAAGYYSYMWAELLEADVFERIKEMGMFDKSTGEKLLKTIIGQGSRKDAKDLFRDFMGRDLDNKAFMERKGL